MFDSPKTRRAAIIAAGILPFLLTSPATNASALCRTVKGTYVERDTSGDGCTSPVGLCIAGKYSGSIRGDFAGQATSIVATADTPTTNVLAFTSDSTIDARIGNRSGTLIIKNAGVFRTAGEGSIVDLQTIVGGTGAFAAASGDIRAEGTFSTATGGMSHYSGTVCLP